MIWNGSSTVRIFCTLVAITCCSGCGVADILVNKVIQPHKNHVDLSDSTSDGVATIQGETFNVLILALYCWIESPANAKRVTVNAGFVDIEAACSMTDEQTAYANFRFEALAGHAYRISYRDCAYCIALHDVTADEVVVRAPYSCKSQFCANLSTGNDWAIITRSKKSCVPTMGQGSRKKGLWLYIDAGPITVDAICKKSLFGFGRRKTSSFDFIAESGHTYTFSAKKKECMRLLDITSEETVISCEPYELIE